MKNSNEINAEILTNLYIVKYINKRMQLKFFLIPINKSLKFIWINYKI
jgi:hypothetical protein